MRHAHRTVPFVIAALLAGCGDGSSDGDPGVAPAPLRLVDVELPPGLVGQSFAARLPATGGVPPYIWELEEGFLPDGVRLESDIGLIFGRPTMPGSFDFTVKLSDSALEPASVLFEYRMSIARELRIEGGALPDAIAGDPYQANFEASGGATPYTYRVAGGELPRGLELDARRGQIAGSVGQGGIYTFVIEAVDAADPPQRAQATYSVFVTDALIFDGGVLPDARRGESYETRIFAIGGSPPLSFEVSSGELPAGLTLRPDGTLRGTPGAAGVFDIEITATDSGSPARTATAPFLLTVVGLLELVTETLPQGRQGTPYEALLESGGGRPPFVWRVTEGRLPTGMTLAPLGGLLFGVSEESGSFDLTIELRDSAAPPQVQSRAFTLELADALAIETPRLPDGTVGEAYSVDLQAAGGLPPHRWSLRDGVLPAGLELNEINGRISGTPAEAGRFEVEVELTDLQPPAAVSLRGFVVEVAEPLALQTAGLPEGVAGVPYAAIIDASGGAAPLRFRLADPEGDPLPEGLSLAEDGRIVGAPVAETATSVAVVVTDSGSPQREVRGDIDVTVRERLEITTTLPPAAQVDELYELSLEAQGGLAPYSWRVSRGALPTGLTLEADGTLRGTPESSGATVFGVTAQDSSVPAQLARVDLVLTILPALTISTETLDAGQVGLPYGAQLLAEGGRPPYAWSVASGDLPAGLELDPTSGRIRGTPAAAGQADFRISVTDSAAPPRTREKALRLVVFSGLRIVERPLPAAVVGTAYDAFVTAEGGTLPYSFSVVGGLLPPGLTLAEDGRLSGAAEFAGAFAFEVEVTDAQLPPNIGRRLLTIVVGDSLSVDAVPPLPAARLGAAFEGTTAFVRGGAPPVRFEIAEGLLPLGLTLDASSGVISGVPERFGAFDFDIRVVDGADPPQEQRFGQQLEVRPVPRPLADANGGLGGALGERSGASDGTAALHELGFSFEWGGVSYTQAQVSPHGVIALGGDAPDGGNVALPDGDIAAALIAPFWDALDPSSGEVRVVTLGPAGQRVFVAHWQGVSLVADAAARLSFSALLYERESAVELRYGLSTSGSSGLHRGASATVGWQTRNGDSGESFSFEEGTVEPGQGMWLVPDPAAASGIRVSTVPAPAGSAPAVTLAARASAAGSSDDGAESVPLGFNFSYFGRNSVNATVSSNGALGIENTPSGPAPALNGAIPADSNPPFSLVAPFWDDLDPASSGTVLVETLGTAPDQRFVARWQDVAHADEIGARLSFGVSLAERSKVIQMQYDRLTGARGNAGSASIGLRGPSTGIGLAVGVNTGGAVEAGDRLLFVPEHDSDTSRYDLYRSRVLFEDISESGALSPAGDGDDVLAPSTIGFDFPFGGASYDDVLVSSDGVLAFANLATAGDVSAAAAAIPAAGSDAALIAALWRDLRPQLGSGRILTELRGNPGAQRFIVQWDQVPSADDFTDEYTFQAVLHEDGRVHLAWAQLPDGGAAGVVGVQSADAAVAAPLSSPSEGLGYEIR